MEDVSGESRMESSVVVSIQLSRGATDRRFSRRRPPPLLSSGLNLPRPRKWQAGVCARNELGFSLIETLVASLILAIVLLAVGSVYPRAMRAISMGGCRARASNLAQKKLEELFEAASSGDLTGKLRPGTYQDQPEPRFTRTWSIVEDEPEPGVASLSVTVAWRVFDKQRSITFHTLLALKEIDI